MGSTPSTLTRSSSLNRQRDPSLSKRSSKTYYVEKVRQRCTSPRRSFISLKDENEDTFRKEQKTSSQHDGYFITEEVANQAAKRQAPQLLQDRPWPGEYVKRPHQFKPAQPNCDILEDQYVGHQRRSQIAPFLHQKSSVIPRSSSYRLRKPIIHQRPNKNFEFWKDNEPLLEAENRFTTPYSAR
ncbi:hypothetical protein BGZ60DRAFT_531075 [Tricladium varicosporioides]|nr:hypothetical protein BGZ60DRAFT_531075 [Hymenoscyphus varicosporioides]